jgi:hypothetical protein
MEKSKIHVEEHDINQEITFLLMMGNLTKARLFGPTLR